MVVPCPLFCLHCEKLPPINALGLCRVCIAVKGIKHLYVRRRGWTPEWEMHLRRLTERARQRLPLFENEPSRDRPPEGCHAPPDVA
jgi:hypothetical protein